jgi:cyclic pyranopterin phosphate synthase
MPEEKMDFAAATDLLSFTELYQLTELFSQLGISKVRVTGGEPFVRKGTVSFIEKISQLPGIREISVTTNGSIPEKHIERLRQAHVETINVSLDALDRDRFYQITRRDCFEEVYANIFLLLEKGFKVKLNCVVSAGKNTEDILSLVALTQVHDLSVRFLEEMPFNGSAAFTPSWNYQQIYEYIHQHYSPIEKLEDGKNATSVNYKIRGYRGSFGIIPAFSRTFCGTCNRIRLSAIGELRTCLYGPAVANLRDLLRSGVNSAGLTEEIRRAVSQREKDGFAAEARNLNPRSHASMSVLGG